MHIRSRPQHIDIVPFVCRVHFGAILLEVYDVVVSDHALCCLVNGAFFNEHLLVELHRLIEDSDVTLANQIILLIAVEIASGGEILFTLTHFDHISLEEFSFNN